MTLIINGKTYEAGELIAYVEKLEKKNEALKGQMSLHEGLLWNDLHKLEKENAELQELYKKADENWWNAQQIIKKQQEQIEKMKCCINDLVHLGEFNEYTDEEYFNYQVHEALKNAEQFIKEIKEK